MRNQSSEHERVPDSKARAVLSEIIRQHLSTGEPVGSRTVSEKFTGATGWSSATIRNVMAELEETGLVEQPHTSAGRVPTDKGYRFYVDHMVPDTQLSQAEMARIHSAFNMAGAEERNADTSVWMGRVSHLLSQVSRNVGIVMSGATAEKKLEHVEFLQLADERILVVLVFAHSFIQHRIIRIDESFSQEELERTGRYLNTEFKGRSLRAIRTELMRLLQEGKALYDELLQNAAVLFDESLVNEEPSSQVYVDGTSNILAKSDFSDIERLRDLLRTFEEKSRLLKILNECVARESSSSRNVHVVIGREHSVPAMHTCALITAPYYLEAGELVGSVGVVGPVRIEYARMMAVVNYVAQLVEQGLRHEELYL